jgi:hypothetical protein
MASDGGRANMPYKDGSAQKEAQRRWYLRKRDDPNYYAQRLEKSKKIKARVREENPNSRKRAKEASIALFEDVERLVANARAAGCSFCDEKDSCCLDFHHVDPRSKGFGIARRVLKRHAMQLAAEIKKCVVVCKNCHAKIHAGIIHLDISV